MRKDREQIAVAFGRALRAERERAAISQEELAFRAGVDRTFISRAERGVRQPALTTVFMLADALEISASDLVGASEKQIVTLNNAPTRSTNKRST